MGAPSLHGGMLTLHISCTLRMIPREFLARTLPADSMQNPACIRNTMAAGGERGGLPVGEAGAVGGGSTAQKGGAGQSKIGLGQPAHLPR